MHMCMKGMEEAAVSQRRNLFEKSLPWPGLISSLQSSVGVVHLHMSVCVCVLSVGDLLNPLWYRTTFPPIVHSTNLTDSLAQPSGERQPTSKVQIPAEEPYLPWVDRGAAAPTTLFPKQILNRLSPCLSLAMTKTSTFVDSAWRWQLDRLLQQQSNNNLIGSEMTHVFFFILLHRF